MNNKQALSEILTPISPGELIDKITILLLKKEHISDEGKKKNILSELALLEDIEENQLPKPETLTRLKKELHDINQGLWTIEDDIRDCEREKDFSDAFINLARAVYRQNDERSRIKKEINVHLGSHLIEEKSYKDYQ